MRERVRGETERQCVGFLDRLLNARHWIDHGQWSERLLSHHTRGFRHISKNRDRKEVPGSLQPLPAGQYTRTPIAGIGDQCLHCLDASVVRKRPHLCLDIEAIAYDHGTSLLGKSVGKGFKDGLLDEKASRGSTHLTGIAGFSYS